MTLCIRLKPAKIKFIVEIIQNMQHMPVSAKCSPRRENITLCFVFTRHCILNADHLRPLAAETVLDLSSVTLNFHFKIENVPSQKMAEYNLFVSYKFRIGSFYVNIFDIITCSGGKSSRERNE